MANQQSKNKGIFQIPKWSNCSIKKTNAIPMHGIEEPTLNSLGYDHDTYKTKITESVRPGLYHLEDHTSSKSCHMGFPGYLPQNEGVLSSSIDVESELKRLNYINSKSPESRYNPIKNCKDCKKYGTGIYCSHSVKNTHNHVLTDCDNQLIPQYTRELKACNDITSININRFEPLCVDVQKDKRIHNNSYIGSQTRNESKDITRKLRQTLKTPIFENVCKCGKLMNIHSSLGCIYKKDIEKYKVLPTYYK